MESKDYSPHEQLMRFLLGRWIGKAIYIAAELGIADLLAKGPRSINVIARKTHTNKGYLYRVMRALAGVKIFKETEGACFALTPMADCLRTGVMRSIARLFWSDFEDKAWNYVLEGVTKGETPFELAYSKPLFQWLETHPDEAEILQQANAIKASSSFSAIVEAYDFSGINSLVDVGGGQGVLLMEILKENSHMKGVLAELPPVILIAESWIKSEGMEKHCELTVADFFKGVPGGRDAYLLSNILHDWRDEACLKILKNCRDAMRARFQAPHRRDDNSPGKYTISGKAA